MQQVQSQERAVEAFQRAASRGLLSRNAWCLNRSFCFDVKPSAPKQAVLDSSHLTTARFQAVLRMPALMKLELRGDVKQAGGIRLPEQLQCLTLRDFRGKLRRWPSLVKLELLGAVAGTVRLPPSLTSLRTDDGFEGVLCGAPLQHLTKLVLHGEPTGHGAVFLRLSPQLRVLDLDVDLGDDVVLQLPPLLEELVVDSYVTKPFMLPLPPRLCKVRMYAQSQEDEMDIALWRKEFLENLPAGVNELVVTQSLTRAWEKFSLAEPDNIAWPTTVRSLVLERWSTTMQLPAHVTTLSIRDASPVVLTHMLDIATLTALESLSISGWNVWGDGDGQEEQWAQVGGHAHAVTAYLEVIKVHKLVLNALPLACPLQVRLPVTTKKLLLGNDVGGILTNGALPPALEELRVGANSNFNAPLTQFPPTLRVLQLNESFNAPLDNIPDGLQEAVLPLCKRALVRAGVLTLPPAARVSFV
ncbi:hypothetical protein JKP88DRAFT_246082 [Tribonema minus]|uniref:Uncharacterized protein n=1 Tax=Tribonema minus TaxID=303371 RepID=A0A835Z3S1_9STRA|nr:hypothetical protein JKP88DRAFT_246082 [Tribonema minus]